MQVSAEGIPGSVTKILIFILFSSCLESKSAK
jgi:hypothetical protein